MRILLSAIVIRDDVDTDYAVDQMIDAVRAQDIGAMSPKATLSDTESGSEGCSLVLTIHPHEEADWNNTARRLNLLPQLEYR